MAEQKPDSEPKPAQTTPENSDEDSVLDTIAEEALESAAAAAAALSAEVGASAVPGALELPDFDAGGEDGGSVSGLSMLSDVDLRVKVELGRTKMYVEDVLRLRQDSVVELDKAAGDPVDIYVNNRHIARGEVLVLDDNFCVRISEIVSLEERDR